MNRYPSLWIVLAALGIVAIAAGAAWAEHGDALWPAGLPVVGWSVAAVLIIWAVIGALVLVIGRCLRNPARSARRLRR
ncbi:MAG: hypothetical protein MUC68_06950 [Burkholderiaceae bacterium]|jgi:hypothetical protein|nr:hypothetical protein [Burkholderiaceae bacterium]